MRAWLGGERPCIPGFVATMQLDAFERARAAEGGEGGE
jgi:hypothetical protein